MTDRYLDREGNICMRIICDYLEPIVEKYNHPDFFFIEIGAHDGIYVDPIHRFVIKHRWKGILIEPVTHLFTKLKENYKGYDGLIFENIAISNDNEVWLFYHLPEVIDGKDMSGAGSFYKNSWINKRRKKKQLLWWIEKVYPNLTEIKVPCLSYKNLLKKHDVKRIDLLQIDVEGYEFEIIKQIDFKYARPTIIHYEHSCLGSDIKKSWEYLEGNGYELTHLSSNTLAVSNI